MAVPVHCARSSCRCCCWAGWKLALRLAATVMPPASLKKSASEARTISSTTKISACGFFRRNWRAGPSPVMFAAKKPANTYRIFILGESAAMRRSGAALCRGALLGSAVARAVSRKRNLRSSTSASRPLIRMSSCPSPASARRPDGDLWIIYMGNNEMVGPFGAATVFGAKAPPLGFVRLNLAIQKTRIGQLLVDISRRLRGEETQRLMGRHGNVCRQPASRGRSAQGSGLSKFRSGT